MTKALLFTHSEKAGCKTNLNQSGVKDFLADYGYKSTDVDCCIKRLKSRLKNSDSFPHEIGIFLGYPLADVKGFIENAAKTANAQVVGKYIAMNVRQ